MCLLNNVAACHKTCFFFVLAQNGIITECPSAPKNGI